MASSVPCDQPLISTCQTIRGWKPSSVPQLA
ncbi:hypothetical protein POX_f08474 [Penicillium oxalicum]|nr:hypothetical protein POX_f08474 [Penicillium oxalicum]KAI2788087.1 hypothetical protein POX_f08474 [Penicillium oxalicum]